jgi:radical SAM protein with 4Fe4S-binding SPASM domain
VGGIPEIVRQEDTGLLVPPHDIKAISRALDRLLSEPGLSERLGANGQSAVRSAFDLEQNLHRLVDRLGEEQQVVARAYRARAAMPEKPATGPVDVLFLMNAFRTGGEETELLILARHLDRSRFRLHVVTLFGVDEPAPARVDLEALGIAIDQACHAIGDEAGKADYVRALVRRRRIRVVVACQDARVAYRVFEGLRPEECRLVEHGGIVLEASVIPKDRTARYIGVSPAIRDAAAERMADPARAVCVPSMVDTGEYAALDREGLRRAFGFAPDACVVTFVGRLDPKKRVEDLLDASGALLPRYANLRVLVVGGPDAFHPAYTNGLVERCRATPGSERITLAGARGDVPQILTASDILVLPAVGEGMSHAIHEAGAAGLAVIAAEDGAAREQLDDGRAGRLVPPGRPDLIAAELAELIEDAGTRRVLGRRLRDRVERRASARLLVPRWETLLDEAAAPGLDRHEVMVASWDRPLDFPSEIQIQTITTCNATCVMCPYPEVSTEFGFERMDEPLYDRILEECAREPGLRRIEPFLMNEAFTDSRIVDWIARTKQKVPHAMVTVTTNGTGLVPRVTDRLVHSGLDAIWFSFNGATRETYEKIMGISYDRVKANIDYLLDVRPPNLQVFVNMIETRPMAAEIAENIRYWQSRGVQAGASALVNRAGNVANFDELRYTPQGSRPVRTCELVFYKMYVLASGDVVLCCMDWRRQVVLGNLRKQSLREIWNGEPYRRVRRLHVEGEDAKIDLCGKCSYTLS